MTRGGVGVLDALRLRKERHAEARSFRVRPRRLDSRSFEAVAVVARRRLACDRFA